MKTHYETLGVAREATPAMVKAAFLAQMRALESSGLPERERAAHEKLLRQAFIALFDPAGKARYDKQLTPARRVAFHSESVAPHEVASKSPWVAASVAAAVVAAIAGGWYVTHPSGERLEQARKEAVARNRKDRLILPAVERGAKPMEGEPKGVAK